MFTIHEGEIMYKEKYGSTVRQRFYVKPPDQGNVVVLDGEKVNDFTSLFTRIFLPQGYPESVSKDYISYQIWDTAQAFCSTITGTLATQEVLRGVGVGDTTATPLAATVTWVLKDGCGHLGKIIFAYSKGNYLDAFSKKWRLYADAFNDAAMCVEIALPMFKSYTTLLLCGSTVMRAIVRVAGGATRAALTQHHAVRANMADVSAKDSAQETAVNLIGSFTALLLITVFGNSLIIFMTMMVLHIIFNYLAVRAVCLKSLNEPRYLQVIDAYLRKEIIANPCEVNKNEPLIFYQFGSNMLDRLLCGFHINIGNSMKNVVKGNPKAYYMTNIKEIYKYNEYILIQCIESKTIYILLRDSATNNDILRAYFHAVLYGIVICAINDYHLPIYKSPENSSRPFTQICQTLAQVEWSRTIMESPKKDFNYEPSFELMTYMNQIVQKEWLQLCTGLQKTGWDLGKHLLIVDEWRICTAKLVAQRISIGETLIPELHTHRASRVSTFGGYSEDDKETEIKTYTIEPEMPAINDIIKDPNTVRDTSQKQHYDMSDQNTKKLLDNESTDQKTKKVPEHDTADPKAKKQADHERSDSKTKKQS